MQSNMQDIKNIFIRKMLYSLLTQILVFGVLIVFVKEYISNNQLGNISNNLLIRDQYTLDKIGSYLLLNDNYALNLELHNLADMKRLDEVKFSPKLPAERLFKNAILLLDDGNSQVYKLPNNHYIGITKILVGQKVFGYVLLEKEYSSQFIMPVFYDLSFLVLIVVGAFVFNFIFLFVSLKNRVESNTKLLLKFISPEENLHNALLNINIKEYKILAEKLIAEKNKIEKLNDEKKFYKVIKNISAQVAHDIRSPLAALNAMIRSTETIPEQQRIMIRNAAQRINDIANNLLTTYRKTDFAEADSLEKSLLSKELVFNLLDHIVSEKRVQYEEKSLKIEFYVEEPAYAAFADISAIDFKRVMSNLINNAVEAVAVDGIIHIYLSCCDGKLNISVKDNGCGMSQELQAKIFKGGVTAGKKEGTGIGLASSKNLVESWDGSILLNSTLNQGTTVAITLPIAEAASWFLKELDLYQGQTLVILDDSQSIHDIWDSRFAHELPANAEIHLQHYFEAELLAEALPSLPHNTLFLVDYELGKNKATGLEVIKTLQIALRAILVTSRDEEKEVREQCQSLGLKILPKTYATHVPFNVAASSNFKIPTPDLVFIDDNKTVTDSWHFVAELTGKSILTFNTIADAKKVILLLKKDTPIYIDSELSEQEKGEIFSKELFEQGFTELYLATGYFKEKFKHCTWLKGVIGKEPPF